MKKAVSVKNIGLVLGYIVLFVPILFSIFYSVPAVDDFAMALGRENAPGFWSELFSNTAYFFTNRGGTIIAFFIEFLINPLNAHVHLGHMYGIYMIVSFVICTSAIIFGIKTIVDYVVGQTSKYVTLIVFLINVILYSTYYYVEAFNWYVGMIAYEFPFAMLFLACAYIIKYRDTQKKKYLVLMIVTGVIAANNTVFDVPIGLFYLYIVYYKEKSQINNKKEIINRSIPLLTYVASGLISVLAPGNYVRKAQYTNSGTPSFFRSVLQTCIDITERTFRIITDHPFTVLLLILLLFLGILCGDKEKKSVNPLVVFVIGLAIQFGSLFPYVFARGFTDTNLAVRIQYILDYFIELTICITCITFGMWVTKYLDVAHLKKNIVYLYTILFMFFYLGVVNNYAYLDIVQIDILKNHSVITSSYELWDGILAEIENSQDENVVIERDYNVSWTPYFLYSGMDNGEIYDAKASEIYSPIKNMQNVYYHKDSIIVKLPEVE